MPALTILHRQDGAADRRQPRHVVIDAVWGASDEDDAALNLLHPTGTQMSVTPLDPDLRTRVNQTRGRSMVAVLRGRTSAAVGVLFALTPAFAACSASQQATLDPTPSAPTSTVPEPAIGTTSAPAAQTVPVFVYYIDESGDLVSRTVPVDATGDRIEQALTIAASPPHEPGLTQAVPAGAFEAASYDGFGKHGQFSVALSDSSTLDAQPGMTAAEARLAIRAAVCTTQIGTDSPPVVFVLNKKPVSRLFGQPLTDGTVTDGHCPPEGHSAGVPQTEAADAPQGHSSQGPQLVQDAHAPVAHDLQRLAKMFARYAVGKSDSFPHWESVSMSIGGQSFASIDDIEAALSSRAIWRGCPGDWEAYGASSCPVDLLGPFQTAVLNDAVLVYSAEYGEVMCAPHRSNELPSGRVVVLRPTKQWRTCATDFALALVADEQGRLRSVDLTLSNP